jgi:hypothetical protein
MLLMRLTFLFHAVVPPVSPVVADNCICICFVIVAVLATLSFAAPMCLSLVIHVAAFGEVLVNWLCPLFVAAGAGAEGVKSVEELEEERKELQKVKVLLKVLLEEGIT